MDQPEFIWQNGQLVPWASATTHVLSHGLHYGSGAFEGIRCYKTPEGPCIFKLDEHIDRLYYSTSALSIMIPYSKEEMRAAIIQTVAANGLEEGYIRPIAYLGAGPLRVVPATEFPVEVVIACWPWGAYIQDEHIDMAVSKYIRIHPKSSVADAKICGHYVNSMLAGLAIKGTGYHAPLMLDSEGYVAEGSAANIFIVKDGALLTTQTGTILEGITRNTIIELAGANKIPVEETLFKPEAVQQADEAFVCGTAVEVKPVRSLDDVVIGNGAVGPITRQIQSWYADLTRGKLSEWKRALTRVKAD